MIEPTKTFRLDNMHGPTVYEGTYAKMCALAKAFRSSGPYRVRVVRR